MTTSNDHPISVLIGVLIGYALTTCIPPVLWLCFDDMIARLFSAPSIGELTFWQAWGLSVVASVIGRVLFGRRG